MKTFKKDIWHISQHFTGELSLFADFKCIRMFRNSMAGAVKKSGIRNIWFQIMPTHYHIILEETEEGEKDRFVHSMNTSFGMKVSRLAKRKLLDVPRGTRLFEAPYYVKIDTMDQLFSEIRYVHLNPERWNEKRVFKMPMNLSTGYSEAGAAHIVKAKIKTPIFDPGTVAEITGLNNIEDFIRIMDDDVLFSQFLFGYFSK